MIDMEKEFKPVGTPLYLKQRTGNYYVDAVKIPYTVIGKCGGKLVVQEAKCIFPGQQYYNSLPTEIVADDKGEILTLNWSKKNGWRQIDKYGTGYPYIAVFGRYEYYPYLN